MNLQSGDATQGDEDREGVIIEIHGGNGAPPYLVRWEDGHESLLVPSSATHVEHRPPAATRG